MEEKGYKFTAIVMDKLKGQDKAEVNCLLTEDNLVIETEKTISIAVARIQDWHREMTSTYDAESKTSSVVTFELTFFDEENHKQKLSLKMSSLNATDLNDKLRVAVPKAQKQVWESLPIELKTAELGIRFVASLIDGVILFVISFIVSFIVAFGGAQAVATWLGCVVGVIYYITFWTWRGQTPGKMITGIKIVKTDESPIGIGAAIIRYIGYYVSGILLLIGFLWILWDRRKQGLHDKIAGTVVIKIRP